MTINLSVRIDLSTTKDEGLIERALRWRIRDLIMDDAELLSPDDPGLIIGIIQHVEVTVK